MSFARPGTYVDETLLQSNTQTGPAVAVCAFVGEALRGPTSPVRLQSWSDATRHFGQFTGVEAQDRLLQAIFSAFLNGARTVYACRAIGAGGVAASLVFNLEAADGADAAIKFSAVNPGTWGNQIYVEVLASTTTGRSNIVVREVPVGAAISNTQIVERWNDVSLDPRDNRYLLGVINSEIGGSNYIKAELNAGWTFVAGDNLAPSGVAGGSKLASGANGAAIDVSTDFTPYTTAVYKLDAISEPFVLNLPGITTATVIDMLASYADPTRTRTDSQPGRGDVFVVVDCDLGVDEAAAVAKKNTYVKSDVMAMYYPGILISDPTNAVRGSTKLVPPGGSVIGRYMATDAARGPFKAPAGIVDGLIQGALGLDPAARLRNSDLDSLNLNGVNAIKSMPGVGPAVIYGARTLRSDYITRYVNARRTLISTRADLTAATRFAVFENNDPILWASLFNVADRICRTLYAAGGLKGASAQEAYYVVCDASNNTPTSIELGQVVLEVGLALQRPAEFVVLRIGQWSGGTTIDEITP